MLPFHNQVQLIGRAGHEVELIHLTDGGRRATLRLYQKTRRGYGASLGTEGFTLIAWDKVAERLAEQVRRGDRIIVQGKLVNRQLRADGRQVEKTEIHLHYFSLMGSRSVTRSAQLVAEPGPRENAVGI